jgi:hypothetical protein
MEWIVSIENKTKERIVVNFEPINSQIHFLGQHKSKNEWNTFVTETRDMKITVDEIQDVLLDVYEKLKIKLESYTNLSEIFKEIKTIEIKE